MTIFSKSEWSLKLNNLGVPLGDAIEFIDDICDVIKIRHVPNDCELHSESNPPNGCKHDPNTNEGVVCSCISENPNECKTIVWPEKRNNTAENQAKGDLGQEYEDSGWNLCHDAFMKVINSKTLFPEKKPITQWESNTPDGLKARGWNACIDEAKRLNQKEW